MSSALLRFPWLLCAGVLFYLISASIEDISAEPPIFQLAPTVKPTNLTERAPQYRMIGEANDTDKESLSLSGKLEQLQKENESLNKNVLELSRKLNEHRQSFFEIACDYLVSVGKMDFSNLLSILCGIGQLFIWSWQIWLYYLRNRLLAWKLSAIVSFHLF